jgi:hypothetical protein
VDGLPYPLHWPTAHSHPLRGQGLPVRRRPIFCGDGRWHLLREGKPPGASLPGGGFDLSSLLPTYGILHIVNGFLLGGAYPL